MSTRIVVVSNNTSMHYIKHSSRCFVAWVGYSQCDERAADLVLVGVRKRKCLDYEERGGKGERREREPWTP